MLLLAYNIQKLYEESLRMKAYEIAKRIINDSGGIATTLDFKTAGLEKYSISNLCKEGLIVRIRHGYYSLPDSPLGEEQLLSKLLPEGIVCLESALYHYGYSDYAPLSWSVAVPRTISQSKLRIEGLPLNAHYIPEANYGLGISQADFNGVNLRIYDKERTICDCFKYRNQMDNRKIPLNDTVLEALKEEKQRQEDYAKLLGNGYDKSHNFIVRTVLGKPYVNLSAINRVVNRLTENAGLPHCTIHGFRHSVASILDDNGVPIQDISVLLGHESVQTTERIYINRRKTAKETTINALDSAINLNIA